MISTRHFDRSLLLVGACAILAVTSAKADEWNDRTLLTFSAPVMVPGATLQPGSYEFALADPMSSRHTVRITKQGGGAVTIAQAIPIKRLETSGDVTLTFNPTDGGPVALKAWYYPGSAYGHQFVYSESEARDIADRSRTVVLSGPNDGPGGTGTLFTVNPGGSHGMLQTDQATQREWDAWRQQHQTKGATSTGGATASADRSVASNKADATSDKSRAAGSSTNGAGNNATAAAKNAGTAAAAHVDDTPRRNTSNDTADSVAPMIQQEFKGTRVALDTLEDDPHKYVGQDISVDGKVERVLGPRLFTIDEPNWIDLEGELLVLVPSPMAALVREDDRITVSGTIKPFVKADFDRESGWLGLTGGPQITLSERPVLVAQRVVGGNNDVAMLIDASRKPADSSRSAATGTSNGNDGQAKGSGGGPATSQSGGSQSPMTSLNDLTAGGKDLVGREVRLQPMKVERVAKDGGFFVGASAGPVYVLPNDRQQAPAVQQGDMVSISGRLLEMPDAKARQLREAPDAHAQVNDELYILATHLQK